MEYWKISDFAKEVGKHQNTVDGWFKQLEEKKVHWVNRSEHGEKIYSTLDMKIAKYIKEMRDQKWALDAIFHELPNRFELRPVPEETTSDSQILDLTAIRNEFESITKDSEQRQIEEMKQVFQEIAATQIAAQMDEVKNYYESIIKQLPQPKSIQEERQERITEMATRRRIGRQLEKEALNMWSTKPEEERVIKVGWFRKEENKDKRDEFVKDYMDEHFESRLKKEFDLE